MARGHWRNWDETECPACGIRYYVKYGHDCLTAEYRPLKGVTDESLCYLYHQTGDRYALEELRIRKIPLPNRGVPLP